MKNVRKWTGILAVVLAGLLPVLAGCGGGEEKGAGDGGEVGKRHGELAKAEVPVSFEDGIEKVKAAVGAVVAAEGKDAVDLAGYEARDQIGVVADYFVEVEAGKVADLAVRAQFRGSVQNLRVLGEKLSVMAHAGAEAELLGKVGKLIGVELGRISGYLGK